MESNEQFEQSSLWLRYVLFVMQFLGAGFIAGSVVHFGEGVTTWDIGVLLLGIVLFTFSLVYKETRRIVKKVTPWDLVLVIISSLFLSLTIGMASGGTQHFIDTPLYAALLIPAGLSLGFVAFAITQRAHFTFRQWCALLTVLSLFAVLLHIILVQLNDILPDSIRKGHGSESHGTHTEETPELHIQDDHRENDAH